MVKMIAYKYVINVCYYYLLLLYSYYYFIVIYYTTSWAILISYKNVIDPFI